MKTERLFVRALLASLAIAPVACAIQSDPTATDRAALRPIDDDPPDPPPTTPPPPPPPPSFETLMARYASFDINSDGFREINSLSYAQPDNVPPTSAPKGMAIVFVDPRYLTDSPTDTVSSTLIKLWLGLYRADLMADGYDPRFVAADVDRSSMHQDGRILMSLRRFLKDVRASYPLRQVLFIGDFPEATILRRTMLRGNYTGPLKNGIVSLGSDAIWVSSELVAGRTELPLADLDGNWEALYNASVTVTDVTLIPTGVVGNWPVAGGVYVSKAYTTRTTTYSDVFYVRDDDTGFWEYGTDGRLTVSRVSDRNPELAPSDVNLANPIARPELQISRINPKHIAVQPFTFNGSTYESALDPDGFPNSVPAYNLNDVVWREDRNFERQLLLNFFQRARGFRYGSDNQLPFRAAGIRAITGEGLHDPGSISTRLGAASGSFGSPRNVDWAKLDAYVAWLKDPAVLRGISTHSGAVNSWFGGPVPSSTLEAATGSRAFTWVRDATGIIPMLIPTYDRFDGNGTFIGTVDANMRLHRALFASRALASAGQRFYVPLGCEVNSPAGFSSKPYSDAAYAPEQNAESMLFFVNGLGVLARAKVFNDFPPTSAFGAIASAGNFGAALPAYFTADAALSSLNNVTFSDWPNHRERTLQRKRAYNWAVIGDGMLRLRY